MNRRRTPMLILTPLALGLVAACGGDDDSAGGDFGGGDFSVRAALGQLPEFDDDSVVMISMADIEAATEANGLEHPGADAARDEYAQWMMAMTASADGDAHPVYVAPPEVAVMTDLQEYADVAGVSFLDATVFATASSPPDNFTVLGGIEDAELSDDLIELSDGIVSSGEMDDYAQDLQGDRIVDQLGRSIRFAQADDRVASSLSTPMIEGWHAGDAATLADDESLAAVADGLDAADADVISAAIFAFGGEAPVLDERLSEQAREQLGVDKFPAGATTIGLGWAADDDGDAVMTAVYDFGDEDRAADMVDVVDAAFRDANSVQTGEPLSDLVEVDGVEASGRIVVATLRPGPEGYPGVIYRMVQAREVPFVTG